MRNIPNLCWALFEVTGDVETYLLYREAERQKIEKIEKKMDLPSAV